LLPFLRIPFIQLKKFSWFLIEHKRYLTFN
jgi:hypothetical protein